MSLAMYGRDAAGEDEAEQLYAKFKADLSALSPEAQSWFWLKISWFMKWRQPYAVRDAVQQAYGDRDGPGPASAHIHRPGWIRGRDAFDRGDACERLSVPL